jgi:drug/metabolite transporter (DMT)-like permease
MSLRAWSAFAAISFLWGIPYLFIKVAVDDGVPPVFLAWVRIVVAAVVLLALAWHAGTLGTVRGRARWILAFAIAEIAIPFPLISIGEVHVDSSLAAIVIAAVPLIVAVLALGFAPSERASGSRLVGLLIGFGGVVALVGLDLTGSTEELLGALAILGAAVGYAIGPMVLRARLGDLDARAAMGVSLGVAAVLLAPFAAVDLPAETPSGVSLMSIAVLGLFCTAVAFVVYSRLVSEVGAGRAVVITYVAPVVALALGVAVLGESPGPGAIVGLLLILAGSWISTDGRLPPGLAAILARRPARAQAAEGSGGTVQATGMGRSAHPGIGRK